jgi:hypothetical protein
MESKMSSESYDRPEETVEPKTNLPVPAPAAAQEQAEGKATPRPTLPTREEMVVRIEKLVGAVALGVLPPARGKTMLAGYQSILGVINDDARSNSPVVVDQDVLAILRQQPDLLQVLAPFLTADQLELIVQEANQ